MYYHWRLTDQCPTLKRIRISANEQVPGQNPAKSRIYESFKTES